jgi:hypothetical protein
MDFKHEVASQAYREVLREVGNACATIELEMRKAQDPGVKLGCLTMIARLRIEGMALACKTGSEIDNMKATSTVATCAAMHQMGIEVD